MKRAWSLAVMVCVGFASVARADEVPEVSATARVTYYLELSGMPGDKSEALVARLRREFPAAQVELLEGTLRVQTDGATFAKLEKVLEGERLDGLPAPGGTEERAPKERKAKKPDPRMAPREARLNELHDYLRRLGQELGGAAKAGELARIRVKVGDLCEGCAECLAAALGKEFPRLEFVPDDAEVVVEADASGQAAVQAWLADLRRAAKALPLRVSLPGEAVDADVIVLGPDATVKEDGIVVLEPGDGKEGRVLFKGGGPQPGPRLEELERRLREAREAGHEREAEKLEVALQEARKALQHVDADALRRHAEMLRGRLEGLRFAHEEREEDLGAMRERVEALRARLEGFKDDRRDPKPGADRPKDARKKDAADGPLAEGRRRVHHLKQALEHLRAAGAKDLAEKVAAQVKETMAHMEQMAQRMRAAEEAAAADRRKMAERKRLEDEEARAREHRKARVEHGLEREGGEELTQLIRRLHQQVEELRKEVRELRERVGGGERRDAR